MPQAGSSSSLEKLRHFGDSHDASRPGRGVQPLSVVDKSDFSPSRLTFPLEAPYSSFSEGNRPFTSFQAKRISS